MSRKELTLADKIDLLDKLKSLETRTSYRNLERITNIPKSTIARIKSQEVRLREEWGKRPNKSRKRIREGRDADVDEALNQWFSIVNERGVHVTDAMLKAKSKELAANLGNDNFNATEGWLSRWKTRNQIKFKKEHGEKTSADSRNANQWELCKLPGVVQLCDPDDIYNAKRNHEEFLCIDSDPSCYCEYEDTNDAIIEENSQKNSTEEDTGSDVEIDELVPVRVTAREARRHLLELRRYFVQVGNAGSPLSALDVCEEFINLQAFAKRPSTKK